MVMVRIDYYKRGTKIAISFCNGVPAILEEINDYFFNCNGIIRHYHNYYTLSFEKKEDVKIVSRILYSCSNYYLERKYKKAMSIIRHCSNTELI